MYNFSNSSPYGINNDNSNNNNAYNQYANTYMNAAANNNQYGTYNNQYNNNQYGAYQQQQQQNTYNDIAANMYQYGSSVGNLPATFNTYHNANQQNMGGSAQNLYSANNNNNYYNNNNNGYVNNFDHNSMSKSSNYIHSKPLPKMPPVPPDALPSPLPSSAPNLQKMKSNSSPNLNAKTKKMKFKLRVGSKIEVWSNSKQAWIDGQITKLKGKLVLCSYGQGKNEGKKWLEATSKDFRPKEESESLGLNQSNTNLSTFDSDYMNNPTAARFRKSVAFQQKESVKVKLRVGSLVEVFSVSKNKWIDGKLSGIKGKLIRVSYGKDFNTEKWLKADSKQFRAKLDMVDNAWNGTQDDNGYSLAGTDDTKNSVVEEDTFKYNAKREHYRDGALDVIKGTKKRGDLVLRIHGALELRNNANFCKVELAEHSLKTKKCSSSANPVWKEILTFGNFRPKIGKTAKVILLNKKAITGEKVVASAEFEVPIVFGRQEKMTIDVLDKNGKPSGLLVLEQCINEV